MIYTSIAFTTSLPNKVSSLGEQQCDSPVNIMAGRNGLKQMSVRSVKIAKKTHPTGTKP